MGAGVNKNGLEQSVYTVLLGEASMLDARVQAQGGFDLIPANRDLAGAEVEMVNMPDRETKLKGDDLPADILRDVMTKRAFDSSSDAAVFLQLVEQAIMNATSTTVARSTTTTTGG